jgi:hypothetical protein
MQKDLIWAYNQMAKKSSTLQKKAQKDLWEITGCAQIQEIVYVGLDHPVYVGLHPCE